MPGSLLACDQMTTLPAAISLAKVMPDYLLLDLTASQRNERPSLRLPSAGPDVPDNQLVRTLWMHQ